MKQSLSVGGALLLSTSVAYAGGIDRGGNAYSILFEDGNYVELSFSSAMPNVSGDYPVLLGGGSTGDMAEDFTSVGVAFKYAINNEMDVALFLNQPYGANASYGAGAYTGLGADWSSNQIAAVLKYQLNDNVSVYGGIRSVESSATIAIPAALFPLGYTADAASDRQTSYIAGAAYERPEIALRVALTYESGFTHSFATTETAAALGGAVSSTTNVEMPRSLTLDFQSGVAEDTLVFGSIRWSEWSVWEVRPAGYLGAAGDAITGLDNDVTTYRIGVGRRINDDLSVFARVTYEAANGGEASRLAPTDGTRSIGIGGSYNYNGMKLTGGVEYSMLGNATDASGVAFNDNTALGFGLSVGYSF